MSAGNDTGIDTRDATGGDHNQDADTQAGNTAGDSSGKTYTESEFNSHMAKMRRGLEKQFTRDLDAKIKEASDARLAEWRDEQGLDDETLEKVGKQDEWRQVQKELSSARGALTKKEKEALAYQEKYERAHGFLKKTRGRDAVYKAASQLANDPEDMWLHLQNRIEVDEEDWSVEILNSNGDIDPTASIEDMVKELLDKKPWLAKTSGRQGAGSKTGPVGQGNGKPQHDVLTSAGLKAAVRDALKG